MFVEKTVNPDIFLELGADALVVPRMHDDNLIPGLTGYIYSKGDAKRINDFYKMDKGKAYVPGEEFLYEYSSIEYKNYNHPRILANSPEITITKAYGLEKYKYIFHVCVDNPNWRKSKFPISRLPPFRPYTMGGEENPLTVEPLFYSPESISGGSFDKEDMVEYLTLCYKIVLDCAVKYKLKSIIFPALGMEEISSYYYEVAYLVANTAPDEWKKTHMESSVNLDILVVEPPLKYTQNSWFLKVLNKPQNLSEVYSGYEKRLKDEINISGKPKEQFAKEFFKKCFKESGVSIGEVKSRTLLSKPERIRDGKSPHPRLRNIIAVAVALELDKYHRYAMVQLAGHTDYPSGSFSLTLETLMDSGITEWYELQAALLNIDPKFTLTDKEDDEEESSETGKEEIGR